MGDAAAEREREVLAAYVAEDIDVGGVRREHEGNRREWGHAFRPALPDRGAYQAVRQIVQPDLLGSFVDLVGAPMLPSSSWWREPDTGPTLAAQLDCPSEPRAREAPMINDPTAVLFVLAAVVAVAVALEARHHLFRSLGSALLGILFAMVLSNTGIIPGESSAYVFLSGPAVSAGIALILLGVDVRTVIKAGPTMLAAFAVGAVGSVCVSAY